MRRKVPVLLQVTIDVALQKHSKSCTRTYSMLILTRMESRGGIYRLPFHWMHVSYDIVSAPWNKIRSFSRLWTSAPLHSFDSPISPLKVLAPFQCMQVTYDMISATWNKIRSCSRLWPSSLQKLYTYLIYPDIDKNEIPWWHSACNISMMHVTDDMVSAQWKKIQSC